MAHKSFFHNSKQINLLYILIIIGICFFVFLPIISFSFISWDDNLNIYNNAIVLNFSIHNFSTNIDKIDAHIMLTTFLWGSIYKIFGTQPLPFHTFCLILHVLNCILIFFITEKISKNPIIALITALLFSIHPMHIESIAWASGAKDLLYSFFFLCSILLYFDYIKTKVIWKFILVVLFSYLSSRSKIQAVSLPFILIIIDLFLGEKINLKNILGKLIIIFTVLLLVNQAIKLMILFVIIILIEKNYLKIINRLNEKTRSYIHSTLYIITKYKKQVFIFFIVIIGFFAIKYFFQSKFYYWDFDRNIFSFTLYERFLMFGYSFNYYLLKFFFPIKLFAIHPYPDFSKDLIYSKYLINFVISVILLFLFLAIFLIIKKSSRKIVFFGFLFYLINISLVLHLIPIQGRLVVADRYVYVAYFGLFYLFASFIYQFLYEKKIMFWMINIAILVLLGFETKSYCKVWKNSMSLYSDVINKNPEASFAYNNRGNLFKEKRQYVDAINDYSLAIKHFRKYSDAYYNRGIVNIEIRNYSGAIKDFDSAISYNKVFDPEIITSRGWAKFQNNEIGGAIADFDKAIAYDSTFALPYNNRGWVKFSYGDIQGAIKDINNAIRFNPKMYEAFNNRGWIKLYQNDITGAIYDFDQAINLNPLYETAIINLAWAYFLNKDYRKSSINYKRAITLNQNNPKVYFYLGLAELNLNNLAEACENFSIAKNMGYTEAVDYYFKTCSSK